MAELPELTHEEIARYSRHLLLADVGVEGQQRLKAAKVLIVGTGGLGAPIALYLAAACVGTIGLVDFDVVEESNLQRQIIHSTRDIHRPKVASAKDRIRGINPLVNVVMHNVQITSANALEIIEQYDIVADGTDNYQTRYLLNDASVFLHKPVVYGSIYQFDGQVSVFSADDGPCYRCLYPAPPPPGLVPSCAEGGVLGVLPGIVGSMQASEVIKLILGKKAQSLIGRLLLVDAMNVRFRELKISKDENCPVCGKHPVITELIDYEVFCGISLAEEEEHSFESINALELKSRLDNGENVQVIDVREPHEWLIAKLDGAKTIPLGQLSQRIGEIDAAQDAIFMCKVGKRSLYAMHELKQAGYTGRMINLAGGLNAWASDVDTSFPTY